MKVAILGCGPAGLMAAHAVARQGHEPIIYSKKIKSQMFGAMYLHERLPDICGTGPDFTMRIMKTGTAREYAEKVYGDPDHPVSFDQFESGEVPAWDLRAAYDRLWSLYSHQITHMEVDGSKIDKIQDIYQAVISSIPAPALCKGGQDHTFKGQDIWVQHGEDVRVLGPDYMMYYMGDPTVPWYRFSRIGHYSAWEYASDPSADTAMNLNRFKLEKGHKPTENDCTCRPNILRVGRFGKWEKGVLTHHAYKDTLRYLTELHVVL